MAYGISTAAARLARLVKGGAGQGKARLALVLRVENTDLLRGSIGPALLDQVLDRLALRLVSDLRFLPQSRAPGSAELQGTLAVPGQGAAPGLLARLQAICDEGVELPDLRIRPVINAVIVSDATGKHDLAAQYACARAALLGCDPLKASGQLRHVEMPAEPTPAARPGFSPDQVRLRFQPQICCDTGEVQALRVLPRVAGPEERDLAEIQPRLDAATAASVTESVLRQALAALGGWDRTGMMVPFLSLALSDRELADPAIAETILWELDRLDLPPERLEIEVQEPIGRSGGRVPVTASLQRLASAGCGIALGEFGTGSAGLADLRRFGIRRVRIGREFTADCDRRADQQRMILAILAVAEHLRLITLADGVATPDERAFLSQIGFDALQGPAVFEPLDMAEVDGFLLRHARSLPPPFQIRRRA